METKHGVSENGINKNLGNNKVVQDKTMTSLETSDKVGETSEKVGEKKEGWER